MLGKNFINIKRNVWRGGHSIEDQITITQAEAARILLKEKSRNLLAPFMKEEQTLTSAADLLNVSTSALAYHIKRFLRLQLLELVRTESRPGRAHKFYRSRARVFVIPWTLAPAETFADFLSETTREQRQRFYREYAKALQGASPDWYIKFVFVGRGIGITVEPTEAPQKDMSDKTALLEDMPPSLEYLSHFRLDHETARGLQKELMELFGRYEELSLPKGQRYALHLGLTPIDEG